MNYTIVNLDTNNVMESVASKMLRSRPASLENTKKKVAKTHLSTVKQEIEEKVQTVKSGKFNVVAFEVADNVSVSADSKKIKISGNTVTNMKNKGNVVVLSSVQPEVAEETPVVDVPVVEEPKMEFPPFDFNNVKADEPVVEEPEATMEETKEEVSTPIVELPSFEPVAEEKEDVVANEKTVEEPVVDPKIIEKPIDFKLGQEVPSIAVGMEVSVKANEMREALKAKIASAKAEASAKAAEELAKKQKEIDDAKAMADKLAKEKAEAEEKLERTMLDLSKLTEEVKQAKEEAGQAIKKVQAYEQVFTEILDESDDKDVPLARAA